MTKKPQPMATKTASSITISIPQRMCRVARAHRRSRTKSWAWSRGGGAPSHHGRPRPASPSRSPAPHKSSRRIGRPGSSRSDMSPCRRAPTASAGAPRTSRRRTAHTSRREILPIHIRPSTIRYKNLRTNLALDHIKCIYSLDGRYICLQAAARSPSRDRSSIAIITSD